MFGNWLGGKTAISPVIEMRFLILNSLPPSICWINPKINVLIKNVYCCLKFIFVFLTNKKKMEKM